VNLKPVDDAGDGPRQPHVITGESFRRDILGVSKATFYAWVKSGRLRHLVAVNLSTRHRTFYVRALAEQWAAQTARPMFGRKRA